MEETNRTALTPEDERLLVRYTDTVIAEEGAVLPESVAKLPKILCAAPPELVDNIYKLQPEKRLIVVTDNVTSAELARVLGRAIKTNHFALYHCGSWEAEPAVEEIRTLSSMLTDADGNELRIAEPVIPGIYAAANGRLLAFEGCLSELDGEKLYGKQFHDEWGTLLPEQFTTETLAGDSPDFITRTFAVTNLLVQIKKRGKNLMPVPEKTLVFNPGTCLVAEWETSEDRDAAMRRLFFLILFGSEESSDTLAAMLPVLAAAETVPEPFLSDLERIYVNGASCSFRKWNNILERLMLDYEENGILKGGNAK